MQFAVRKQADAAEGLLLGRRKGVTRDPSHCLGSAWQFQVSRRRRDNVFMKLGMMITQADPETVFNALRLAVYSLGQGDQVRIFLTGKGVEIDRIEDPKFNVKAQAQKVLEAKGEFLACGSCLKLRNSAGSEICPLSSLKDLYEIVRDSDRVVTI
jgi:sulfur relay (sulfurtransferase) complex TusBCD TusD component (DsrE family)